DNEEGVVVEIGVEMRASVLVGREQPAIAPQLAAHEIEGAARGVDPVLSAEDAPGVRHAADGERVPRNQDLLVATRTDALPARFEQFLLCRISRARDAQVPMPVFEV